MNGCGREMEEILLQDTSTHSGPATVNKSGRNAVI